MDNDQEKERTERLGGLACGTLVFVSIRKRYGGWWMDGCLVRSARTGD